MPTHVRPPVRRSGRTRGDTIKSPKYKHDLFKDPPDVATKRKHGGSRKQAPAVSIDLNDQIVESEDEVTVSKSHPSKNYSKLVLYDKWKATSKAAST